MLSTSAHMSRLQDKLSNIKEALHYTDVALAHDDYSKPFHFKNENEATPSDFEEDLTRTIIDELSNRKLGFDPDLAVQHIESEALDQFNEIVKKHIKGKGIVHLMRVKHELELFMLKQRKVDHTKALESAMAEITALGIMQGSSKLPSQEQLDNINKTLRESDSLPSEDGVDIDVPGATVEENIIPIVKKKKK